MGHFKGPAPLGSSAPLEPCRASFRAVSGGEIKHLLGVRYFCVALKLPGGACSNGWRLLV